MSGILILISDTPDEMATELYKDGFYIPERIPKEDVRSFSRFPVPKRGFGKMPAVIVVDMTQAFVEDRYPYGCSKTGKPCTRSIRKLLDAARPRNVPIFYTRADTRSRAIESMAEPESKISQINRELDPLSNEIMQEIAPREAEIVVEKAAPSGFFGTPLVALLNRTRVDTVVVTGMTTSGCVRATVVDAFAYRYRVIVPIECVADRSQISHEVSLFDLSMKYAHVMPLLEVVKSIEI